jgi:mannose-6-phosphate isomerase-like protein (cupin superfamily)
MSNIHKIWGTRNRILLTNETEIDLLYTKANTFCSTHKHAKKINKFIVISGEVRIETEFGKTTLKSGDSFEVHPPLVHRFFNVKDSIMIECAYVKKGKINPDDIERFSQGGKIIKGFEMTFDEMRKKGLLEL